MYVYSYPGMQTVLEQQKQQTKTCCIHIPVLCFHIWEVLKKKSAAHLPEADLLSLKSQNISCPQLKNLVVWQKRNPASQTSECLVHCQYQAALDVLSSENHCFHLIGYIFIPVSQLVLLFSLPLPPFLLLYPFPRCPFSLLQLSPNLFLSIYQNRWYVRSSFVCCMHSPWFLF